MVDSRASLRARARDEVVQEDTREQRDDHRVAKEDLGHREMWPRCRRVLAEMESRDGEPRWRAEMESRDGAEISRDQADVAEMSPPSCRAAAVARLCVLGVRARLAPRAGVGKVAGGPAQREAYK